MTAPADDLSIAQRVDTCCDRFEALFSSGQRPRIDDFLAETSEPVRSQLFRSLLELELELRSRAGEQPQPEEYKQRFADQAPVIESVFAGSNQSLSGYLQTRVIDSDSKRPSESPPPPSENSSVNSISADTYRSTQTDISLVPVPTSVGRFQILRPLGEGAFGTVYCARDPQLDRDVAIKVPRAGTLTQEERDRFLREARAAAGLHHPRICSVHEVGTTTDGRDYLVMAFINGKPLSRVLQEGKRLEDGQIANIIREIALALAEAHQHGVIHRDLKPANIMIDRKGEPVVMDFGLARRLSASDPQLSVHGQIMGTPAYMSPEQARGDSPAIGPASDIYSLGVVMYEMLCGQRPFSGTVTEVIGQILHVEAPPPSKFREGIDSQLEAICMKAIAKKPADRFASMNDLATALSDFGKASVVVPVQPAPTRKSLSRRAAMVVGLGAMLGIVFYTQTAETKVSVELTDINIHDPALGFNLDDKNYNGAYFAAPIKLRPGTHRLQVIKNNQIFKIFDVIVVKGRKKAKIEVVPYTPAPSVAVAHSPAPAKTKEEIEKEEGFVELFNGQDLTGWESDTDASSFSVDRNDKILIAGPIAATSKLRRHWLFTREDYSDYVLRLEFFPVDQKVKGAVAIKGKLGSDPQYNIELAIQVRDPIMAPRRQAPVRPTGSLIINGVDGVTPSIVPNQKVDDWNSLEIKLLGSVVTVTLNDQLVQEVDLAKIDRAALPAEAIENLDRRPGRIGLQSMEGTMKYRNIRLRNLAPPPRSDYRKAFGNHTYRFYDELKTWPETLDRCKRLSGRLAVVDSPEKNEFLAQLIADAKAQDAWISVKRESGEGSWQTQNGKSLKYSNWLSGEPKVGTKYGYVSMRDPKGKWRSGDDEYRTGFIMEWDLPSGK